MIDIEHWYETIPHAHGIPLIHELSDRAWDIQGYD